MVVYTWWCWHICKGEEVGEVLKELEFKKRRDGSWIGKLYGSIMHWIKYSCGLCSPLNKLSKISKIIEIRSLELRVTAICANERQWLDSATGCYCSESSHRVWSMLLCGLFRGCDRTLALGHDRTRVCHRSRPGKAVGERSDTRRVRSVVPGRVRLIKIILGTSLFVTGLYDRTLL
jgi:hypothetical protein